jgi:ABC-type bacteriocin/lantibiotic exporter with double-glycine peptidase domain
MPKNKKLNYKSAFIYIFKWIVPYKKWYITASIISLVLVITALIHTKLTQILVDSSVNGDFSKIVISIILYLVVILINFFLNNISGICVSKLSANAAKDLKCNIARILLHAKYAQMIQLKSGDTLSTINSDTAIIGDFMAKDLIGLFSQFTLMAGAIIYLLCVKPILALAIFVYTPIGMFFTLTLNDKMNKLYPEAADCKGEALSVVEQVLSQIPVIKSFVMEKRIKNKISEQYQNVYTIEMKISVWNSLLQTACSSTAQMPRIGYIILGGHLIFSNKLSIGEFIAIFDLLNFIIAPTVYFPFILNGLNKSMASILRIKRLENIEICESVEKSKASNEPQINIKNITFGYIENKPILKDFSFFHKGYGIIALCAESGFGKTTLLDLISGLYKPDSGTIDIEGELSVLSQDLYIFKQSLMENVRVAKKDATDEQVLQAIKMAGADKFAESLGYDTLIGDGEIELSGGQKQRICLARTILKNSSIWLLDEPTSALDTETEAIVLEVIRKMSKNKLIIISAHRKSLIDIADQVVYLKGAERV